MDILPSTDLLSLLLITAAIETIAMHSHWQHHDVPLRCIWSISSKGVCGNRYLGNISIPAAFITQTTGQVLKDLLLNGHTEDAVVILDWTDVLERAETVRESLGRIDQLAIYPLEHLHSKTGFEPGYGSISWTPPDSLTHCFWQVEWEFWSNR